MAKQQAQVDWIGTPGGAAPVSVGQLFDFGTAEARRVQSEVVPRRAPIGLRI